MTSLSVVIITYNEEHNIAECIRSAKLVSDDIVVVDCGSNDETVAIATRQGARTFVTEWKGYGFSKNFGASKVKFNWILSIDADERISEELATSIKIISYGDRNCIYKFKRKNHIGAREIQFGTLGFEMVERIYHRNYSKWDLSLVHEKLVGTQPIKQIIAGSLLHFGLKNFEHQEQKAILYARLSAEKYYLNGNTTSYFQRAASAIFNSIKSYFFLLGFIEGKQGLFVARSIAYYSWLKYAYLYQLLKESAETNIRTTKQTIAIKAVSN
jgi:glycosyltransferase involved in cell wall biosynthesis